jgi:hypothetical protein
MFSRHLFGLALVGAAALPATADTSTVTYSILKEGEKIGSETYQLDRDGEHIAVHLAVESHVRILFLDFNYHHARSESWNGERLERLVADTDDDGTKHHVEAIPDGKGGLSLTSDGKAIALPADTFPLAMWRKAMLGHPTLFALESDDQPYHVSFKDLGSDAVLIGAIKVDCQHVAMTGDVDRDLWYDADGMLAKVTFRRRGFGITILRDPS